MAWITGKVQQYEKKSRTLNEGVPFAYEKNGKWFCRDTGKEMKRTPIRLPEMYKDTPLRENIRWDQLAWLLYAAGIVMFWVWVIR